MTKNEPKISLKYIILFLAVATGVAGGILSVWAYNKFASPDNLGINISDLKDKPSAAEIVALVKRVSQIAILPKGELPEVLVISDLTQMRANPFFTDASIRDYIIIYKKAGRIIVYNPTTNKIINMGPYITSDKQASPSASPKAAGPLPSPTPEPTPSPSAEPTPSLEP